MSNVGEISYDVRLALNKLDADIGSMKSKLNGLKKEGSGLEKDLAIGAGAGASMLLLDKAIGLVTNSIGAAVRRVDTLNNAARVFQAMGQSGEQVSRSMQQLNEDIRGLPTSLDEAVRGVQRLVAVSGSMVAGEQAFKAINDAILAYGGSSAMVDNAITQLSQDFGRGAVQAQTFNSLLNSGMTPVLQAIAKEMGITMGALKEMGSEGKLSAEQLTQKLIELDHNGGGGIESLDSTVKKATGGLQTSFTNMETAITRGMANLIQGLGASNIGTILAGVGAGIETILNAVGGLAGAIGPFLTQLSGVIQVAGSGIVTFALVAGGLFVLQKGFILARAAMFAFMSHPIIALLSAIAAGAVMAAQAFGILGSAAGGSGESAESLKSQLASVDAQIALLEKSAGGSSKGMDKAAKSAKKLTKELDKLEAQAAKIWRDYSRDLNDIRVKHEDTIKDLTKQIAEENANYDAEIAKRSASFRKSQVEEIREHESKVQALTNQIRFLQNFNNSYNAQKLTELQFALDKEQALYDAQFAANQEKLNAENNADKLKRDQKLADLQQQLNTELAFQNKHRADLASVQNMIKLDEIESLKERRDEQLATLQQQKQDALSNNAETNAGILANNGETLEKLKKQREELNNKLKTLDQQQADDGKYTFGKFLDDMWRATVDFFDFGGGRFWKPMRDSLGQFGSWAANLGVAAWNGVIGIGKGMINGLIAQIERVINKPIDLLNGALNIINKIPNVHIPNIQRFSLPRLAKGGVLTTATPVIAGEYLGAKANPEIVTPQKIMADTFTKVLKETNAQPSQQITINVSGVFATSPDERRKVADQIMQAFEQSQKARFA